MLILAQFTYSTGNAIFCNCAFKEPFNDHCPNPIPSSLHFKRLLFQRNSYTSSKELLVKMEMEGNRANAVSVISNVIWKNCKTVCSFLPISVIRQISHGIGYACTAEIKNGGISHGYRNAHQVQTTL